MLTTLQALILGALQGVTELFPISSLGHTVILPTIFHWQIDQSASFFVLFLVATHLATALVLFVFFWSDWMRIIAGFFRSLRRLRVPAGDTYARISWLLIIATIPAGLLGLLFEKKFTAFFAEPYEAALFLIGNGVLLYAAELLRRSHASVGGDPDAPIARLSYFQAFGVGIMESLALFPGFSRTGASLAGGLLVGLPRESAARFAFLLATPIILAAAVLKLPGLLHASSISISITLIGALAAAVCAFLSVKFLTRYFKTNTLIPFAIYCVGAGAIALFLVR